MTSLNQCSALVVEDDPIVRLDLVDTLQRIGLQTYEAGQAKQAIAVLEDHDGIDVMFTDIEMPGSMDGLALAHYVRHRWPPTRIVISSGQLKPVQSLLPTNTEFLTKPFIRDDLARICRELTEGST